MPNIRFGPNLFLVMIYLRNTNKWLKATHRPLKSHTKPTPKASSLCLTSSMAVWLGVLFIHTTILSEFGDEVFPFSEKLGHCVLGDLQCCRNVLVPFPRSVVRHNPVSEIYGTFLRPHGMYFALTCTVNCGTLYRHTHVCLSRSCPII